MTTLALIGVGRWGYKYLKTAEKMDNCKIKYVSSPHVLDKVRINNLYIKEPDYRDLFKKIDIDGVIIATPVDTHFQIAFDFLSHGYNVLIEKPIAKKISEVKKLHVLASKESKVLLTSYPYLYNPAFIEFKKEIKKIGKVINIEINLGTKKEENNDALWEWGPHVFSAIYSLTNKKPVNFYVSKNKNVVSLNMSFENGIMLNSTIGYGLRKNMRTFVCVGEKGTIVYDELAKHKVYLEKDSKKHNIPYSEKSALENQLTSFCMSIEGKRDHMQSDLDYYVTNFLEKSD